jgi:hypothetical protein
MKLDTQMLDLEVGLADGRQFRIDASIFIADLQLNNALDKGDAQAEIAALKKSVFPAEAIDGMDDTRLFAIVLRAKLKLASLGNALAP